jgi:hypothetical protein
MKNVYASDQPRIAQPVLKQRLLLYPGELYRIPPHSLRLRVSEGVAFVTQAAQDMILSPGQEVALRSGSDHALLSCAHGTPVVVELYAYRARTLSIPWWLPSKRSPYPGVAVRSINNNR